MWVAAGGGIITDVDGRTEEEGAASICGGENETWRESKVDKGKDGYWRW